MNKYLERIYNGVIKENPTFVLMLGMCPTLAVTTCAVNGIQMGLTTTAVLIMSNFFISLFRKIIPDKIRIPAYIVIVATLVTIVELLLEAYLYNVYETLGLYIPLIVVNCIILGRAEAYASKNNPVLSAFDGVGMGLGFTIGLTSIGLVRELLGAGTLFGFGILPAAAEPVKIFVQPAGAFFVLAALTALQNKFKLKSATNTEEGTDKLACGGNCPDCSGYQCIVNREALAQNRDK